MSWLGWLREDRRDSWDHVCDGKTMDEAAGRLLEEAARRGVSDSFCRYLTQGSVPPADWMRPKGRKR
jgi:hypothetical protein